MKLYKFLVLFMGTLLTACGGMQVTIEQSTPTALPPLSTSTATAVILPTNIDIPTATSTVAPPTAVPPTALQASPVPTSASGQQEIKIFLIKLEDNGQSGTQVGCGDSAVPITVYIPRTQGILRATMEKLLSAKQQFYGDAGYYNALHQSNLQVQAVTIENGKAIIHLTGTVMLGGECDNPRFEAQIEQTALQFSTVNDVQVFINDRPMEEVLSLK
jgi:hypothetical protein